MSEPDATATHDHSELLAELSEVAGRDLTLEDVIEIVAEKTQRGVNLAFTGKQRARQIARLVRPRVQRTNSGLSVGSAEDQAKNLLIEGDNLQALASSTAGVAAWTSSWQIRHITRETTSDTTIDGTKTQTIRVSERGFRATILHGTPSG